MPNSRAIFLTLLSFLFSAAFLTAQEQEDSDSLIRLDYGKTAELIEINGQSVRKVIGPAEFMHNNTYMLCDTALWNIDTQIIDAIGNVSIIQEGTVLTSDKMVYDIDNDLAQFRGVVVQLEDSDHNTLRTSWLDYNTKDSVAVFENGGSMRDKDGQIIESQKGTYDSKIKQFTFKDDVNMFTDSIFVKTSYLEYKSDLNTATFGRETDAWKDENMLSADAGWYDRDREVFFFRTNVHVMNDTQEGWSDSLYFYRNTTDVDMRGNVQVTDTSRNVTAVAGRMVYVDSIATLTMVRDPAIIARMEQDEKVDTVYVGADTVVYYTLRMCDVDSVVVVNAGKRKEELDVDPVGEYRKAAAEAARKKQEEAMKNDPNYRPPDGNDSMQAGADSGMSMAGGQDDLSDGDGDSDLAEPNDDSSTAGGGLDRTAALDGAGGSDDELSLADGGEPDGEAATADNGDSNSNRNFLIGEGGQPTDSLRAGGLPPGSDSLGFGADSLGFGRDSLAFGSDSLDFDRDSLGMDDGSPEVGRDSLETGTKSPDFGKDSLGTGVDSLNFGRDSLSAGADSLNFRTDSLGFGSDSLGFGSDSLGFGVDSLNFGADSLGFGVDSLGFAADSLAGPLDTTKVNFVWAVGNIRLYKEDMQMVCDSLEYNDLDSLVRMYKGTLIWNEITQQYSADSVSMVFKNGTMEKASLMSEAYIIIEEEPDKYYDQIKSVEALAFFDEGVLSRFDALGSATGAFFLREEDVVATANKTESKMLSATFVGGEIDKVYYFQEVQNDAYPVVQLAKEEQTFKGFSWQPEKRPVDPTYVTTVTPRQSMRSRYKSRPRAAFDQTELYFPGYIPGIYMEISRRDSLERVHAEQRRIAQVEEERMLADSLEWRKILDVVDSLMLSDSLDFSVFEEFLDSLARSDLPDLDEGVSKTDSLGVKDSLSLADSLSLKDSLVAPGEKEKVLSKEELKEKARKEKELARAEREKAKEQRLKEKEAKWALLDSLDQAKVDAKLEKKAAKEREKKRRYLEKMDVQNAKEDARLENYVKRIEQSENKRAAKGKSAKFTPPAETSQAAEPATEMEGDDKTVQEIEKIGEDDLSVGETEENDVSGEEQSVPDE